MKFMLHRSRSDYLRARGKDGHGTSMKRHLVRLDRAFGEMNAWLLALAIGLGMLDLTVLVAKSMPALPPTPAITASDNSAPQR
jgi:hypothetical protein